MSPPTPPTPFDSVGNHQLIIVFLNVVIAFTKLGFFLWKTIHSPLCHPFSPVSWWSFLFCSSPKSVFNPFHLYLALFSPTTFVFSLSHHPPGFKDQLLSMMYEGLYCLKASRHSHWSYSHRYSNVITPWHQGECTTHAEVPHQHEAQDQLFNSWHPGKRHLNLVLF